MTGRYSSFFSLHRFFLVATLVCCWWAYSSHGGYLPDMPDPPAHIITIEKGSIIIPMDSRQVFEDGFNLRAYGMVIHLLHEEIPVYWAIAAGKDKDEIDFSAVTSQICPSETEPVETSYSGGPFIIPAEYACDVLGFADEWMDGEHQVVLHQFENDTDVDIRHILLHKPRILVSEQDAYAHVNILELAGLIEGEHYEVCSEQIAAADCETCFTMIAEHSQDAQYYAVSDFLYSGGNFFAQCSAVESYENSDPEEVLGGFISQSGIGVYNVDNEELLYPNADLPLGQFLGGITGCIEGDVTDFCLLPPADEENPDPEGELCWFQENGYMQVINDPSAVVCPEGQTAMIAAGAKVNDSAPLGGMVFYLGGHDYSWLGLELDGGKRMFLNAALTPSIRPSSCCLNFCPDGQRCMAHLPCWDCTCCDGEPFYFPIEGCCAEDCDCGPCEECLNGTCTAIPGCCLEDADCDGDCMACGCDNTCEEVPGCCASNEECGPCQACAANHTCVDVSDCCANDAYCGPCQTCANNTCIPVYGCCLLDSECPSPCHECHNNQCQEKPSCYMCTSNADCPNANCNCTDNICICPKTGDGESGDGVEGGDGGESKTAVIVGATVGGVVGLAALAGLAGLAVVAAGLLWKFMARGQTPGAIASALESAMDGSSNVNPLHTPQFDTTMNPMYGGEAL